MRQFSVSAFDFEEWALLAKTDPQAFEVKRNEEIARLIAKASSRSQARLRGLQWKIDTERRRASNPLSACVRIFNQMWGSVYGERGLLEALRGIDGRPLPERPAALVLEFNHRRSDQKHNKLSHPSSHP